MTSIKQPPQARGGPVPGERGADPAAAGGAVTGFEARLLAELQMVVTERAAAAGQEAGRRRGRGPARGTAGRAWPRRLAVTGAVSAALAAGLAVTLTVTSTGAGAPPAAGQFAPATTVAAVLDNAALAAQSEPAGAPRRGQFIYTKAILALYQPRDHDFPGERVRQTIETWTSAGGIHVGSILFTGPGAKTSRALVTACVHGFISPGGAGRPERCKPRQYAGYQPWLPTTTAGMRAYLETGPRDGSHAQSLIETGFYLLTGVDLTPAQQAAVYHALARVRGLTVVPKVTDILGRTGVGIRSRPVPGVTWTAIFDRGTFKLLGSDIESTRRPGYNRRAMAVQPTVVNKVGQRP
jgi:hypothetical protein